MDWQEDGRGRGRKMESRKIKMLCGLIFLPSRRIPFARHAASTASIQFECYGSRMDQAVGGMHGGLTELTRAINAQPTSVRANNKSSFAQLLLWLLVVIGFGEAPGFREGGQDRYIFGLAPSGSGRFHCILTKSPAWSYRESVFCCCGREIA